MKNLKNTLKIIYIFLAGIGVFFIGNLYALLGIIIFHLLIFLFLKNPQKSLRFLLRVKWFVVIIFLGNAFVGAEDIILLTIKKWSLSVSYDGMLTGAIMCFRLLSMILITQVIRFSMSKKEFIAGMTGIGLSKSSAEIIDTILDIVSLEKAAGKGGGGSGGGKGGGKGKGQANKNENQQAEKPVEDKAIHVVLKGRVGNIPKKLVERLEFSASKFTNNPNAALAGGTLAITLIRMVKIAPGLPIAPGHKNILAIPVFIYSIEKSKKAFAGLQIGLISGILHFSMGFGKYGALSIFEFALVGGVIDLLLKIPIKRTNLIFLMFIGAIAAIIKVSFEILMIILFLPEDSSLTYAFFLVYLLPLIISQISFGIGSGFISRAILKNNYNEQRTNS